MSTHQRREDRKRWRPCGDEAAPKNNPQPFTTAGGQLQTWTGASRRLHPTTLEFTIDPAALRLTGPDNVRPDTLPLNGPSEF